MIDMLEGERNRLRTSFYTLTTAELFIKYDQAAAEKLQAESNLLGKELVVDILKDEIARRGLETILTDLKKTEQNK